MGFAPVGLHGLHCVCDFVLVGWYFVVLRLDGGCCVACLGVLIGFGFGFWGFVLDGSSRVWVVV